MPFDRLRVSGSRGVPVRTRFYYGWIIVAVCFISTFFSGATAQLFTSIMVIPITAEMGWTRTEMAGALTLGVIATGLLDVGLGPLADRFGPRAIVSLGAVVVTAGFFALSGMQELWHFYAAYVIGRGVAQAAISGVVTSTAVTNWFVRRRGRAMRIMGMAFQFSNTLLIPAAGFLTQAASWRWVYGLLGVGTAAFVIGPAALLLRRRPEDVGLLPDGDAARSAAGAEHLADPEVSFTAREAMRTQAFWLLAAAQFLMAFVSGSLTFNLAPYFNDVGVSAGAVAIGMSVFALGSGFSSTMWGFLSERFSERNLAIVASLLGAAGTAFFLVTGSDLLAVLFCGFYGITARGEGSLLSLIQARYFGRGSYGAIRGIMGPIAYVSLGFGPLVGSLAFDLWGSYVGFLLALVVCHVLMAGLLVVARPPYRGPADSYPNPGGPS